MKVDAKLTLNDLKSILSKRGLEPTGAVQKFIDGEVLRLCAPYMPRLTGLMIKSGSASTKLGEGVVTWKTPYVRIQYYNTPETRGYDARRGGKWFPRAMNIHRQQIIDGAAKMAGGNAK